MRLGYITREFNMRLEERVNERTRIARDLHDTLLQNFQGVLLKFHAVSFLIADRPAAKRNLEDAIEQARDAIIEGRDAVQGLRSRAVITNDLARAIAMLGEGLATDMGGASAVRFTVREEGGWRDLPPVLRDEIYRIAAEALRNAFRHAARPGWRWLSATRKDRFGCVSVITGGALIRIYFNEEPAVAITTASPVCTSVPNWWAAN